jgi:hypothetical protein
MPYFGTESDRVIPGNCRALGRAVGEAVVRF